MAPVSGTYTQPSLKVPELPQHFHCLSLRPPSEGRTSQNASAAPVIPAPTVHGSGSSPAVAMDGGSGSGAPVGGIA